MNKKLLLSFAVFATALSVNAQKRGAKILPENLKAPRNYSVVSDDFPSKSVTNIENTFNTKVSPSKRASQKNVDTSSFFDFKQRYTTAAASGVTILPYMNATKDSVEVTVYSQTIHNKSKAKYTLNGVMLVLGSRNKKKMSSDVNVRIYDAAGDIVANASKKVPYTTGTDFRGEYFIFDKPFTTNEDLTFYVEGESAYDTIRVYSSGAYRNLSISCNITGDKLTLVSPAPTANIGSGFWTGQQISGTGIAAGTTIKSYNAATKEYTLSKAATTNGTNVVVTGTSLTFDDYKSSAYAEYYKFPKLANGEPDKTKQPSFDVSAIHGISGVGPTDGHLIFYPIIEYTYDDAFTASNLCLGNNAQVVVNENQTNPFLAIARNPLLNKMAFYSLLDSKFYYHGAVFTTSKSLSDTLYQSRNDFKVTYNAKDVTKNDTLVVGTMLWKYGYKKPISQPSMFYKTFLLSSKLTDVTTITPAAPKCYYDKANDALSLKGYAPYTGLPKVGDAAGVFKVTDANGCTVDITTTAPIVAVPAKFTWTSAAKVDAAKCFGDKAKVTVTITGGTGTYTGLIQEFATTASVQTKNIVVADPNGCRDTVKNVSIPAGPAKVVATATVTGAKCFGEEASVEVKATGGTGVITGVGIKKFSATAASTQKIEVLDANNCVATVDAAILAAPAKVVATATVTDAKCFGEEASVEVKATGGTGVFTGVGIKKFSATAASTQKIEVLDANKCVATVDAAIKAAPVKLEVTTAATTATSPSVADGKATATPTGGTAPYTYAWDNTDKSTTAEIKVVKGTYNVVVKDANNCTVNGSVKVSSLSVESLSISGLSIYPNPVANELNVKFNAISAATIELVNVAGQVIASKDASEFANVTFDTATLNAGVYFVNIKVAEGVFTQKIIKE